MIVFFTANELLHCMMLQFPFIYFLKNIFIYIYIFYVEIMDFLLIETDYFSYFL